MMMHNAKRKNIKCKNSTKHIVVCNRIVKRGIPRRTQSIVLGATNAGEHRVRRNQNASFHSFAARRDLREVSLFTRTSYARGKKAKTEGRKSHRQRKMRHQTRTKNARRRTRISAPASLASPTPTSYRERPESSLPSSRRRSRLGRLSSFFRLA